VALSGPGWAPGPDSPRRSVRTPARPSVRLRHGSAVGRVEGGALRLSLRYLLTGDGCTAGSSVATNETALGSFQAFDENDARSDFGPRNQWRARPLPMTAW